MWFKKQDNSGALESAESVRSLKVGAVSPRIRLADVGYNVAECVKEAKRAAEAGVQLLVFPRLTLTGATCRDLYSHSVLAERAERGLVEFMEQTKTLDTVCVIGLPDRDGGELLTIVHMGKLTTLVQTVDCGYEFDGYREHDDIESVRFAGQRATLEYGSFTMPGDDSVTVGIYDLFDELECPHIIIHSAANEAIVGSRARDLGEAKRISYANGAVYVLADAGIGESTTDAVYSAHNIIADHGRILAEAVPFAEDNLITADVRICEGDASDVDLDNGTEPEGKKVQRLERRRDYFLPLDPEEQRVACLEALEIQAQGLAARLERSYSRAMVIGVSGGLDSTLALLVCARAADILGMPRTSVIGVTMPCFGTTKRTKSNAERLCEVLGTELRVVDIKASVTQHLHDIGHDGTTPDVTFENAQARERTQVIMDIANMTGGLVVGTGDLSELALGWATYNGDHMSMYAVNGSVPKTMVRRITEVYSDAHRGEGEVSAILDDILATPVSPELLPPKDGEIAQCTEALVGPYELHDYFLYHLMARQLSPRRIYENAKYDFEGVYDKETILGWLRVFVRRFFSQQFKRSCLPDGPKVSCISVSPRCGLSMPSDASAAVWLEELDRIEKEEK